MSRKTCNREKIWHTKPCYWNNVKYLRFLFKHYVPDIPKNISDYCVEKTEMNETAWIAFICEMFYDKDCAVISYRDIKRLVHEMF